MVAESKLNASWSALGELLERLEGILSALGAILAKNVALTCMELHGTAWPWALLGGSAAELGGLSEGRGSIPKGI